MSFLRQIVEQRSINGDTILNPFFGRGMMSSSANVTGYNSMQHSAVYRAVNLITDSVAVLPVDVYKKRAGKNVEIEPPEIISNPSVDIDDMAWRAQHIMSWLTEGNAVGIITSIDDLFYPTQIELFDPFDVQIRTDPDTGKLIYSINGYKADSTKIYHRPGITLPGQKVGIAPLRYALNQIAMGLNAQKWGQNYFINGVKANGILSFQGKVDGDELDRAKERFIHSAQNAGEPVALSGDMKYQSLNINAAETQFLEAIGASVEDIARFYGMSSERLGVSSGTSMTYSNTESKSLEFRQETLNPWITRLERALDTLMKKGLTTKINRDAALAIDTTTRYSAHEKALRNGFASPDEIRELENRPPIPDGTGAVFNWPPMSVTETQGQQ